MLIRGEGSMGGPGEDLIGRGAWGAVEGCIEGVGLAEEGKVARRWRASHCALRT